MVLKASLRENEWTYNVYPARRYVRTTSRPRMSGLGSKISFTISGAPANFWPTG